MGWSKHHRRGLIYAAPQRCYNGYTLLANVSGGYDAYLVDLAGHICHHWHADAGISYASLLPNGHLLVTHPPQEAGPATSLPGAASLLEWTGRARFLWQYRHPCCITTASGSPTAIRSCCSGPDPAWRLAGPGSVAASDRAGAADAGRLVAEEIAPDGTVVTQWYSWEHLNPDTDIICPLESRHTWTHGNAITVTPHGDWLVSFRQISVVGLVERATGHLRWKWGPGALSHQHAPTYVAPEHVLLFDNGAHRYGQGAPYSRVVEVDVATDANPAWEYRGDPPFAFLQSPHQQCGTPPQWEHLDLRGSAGRLFEVTADHEIVWEYLNPFDTPGARAAGGGPHDASNAVFRAHRYGPQPPGLAGQGLKSRALCQPEQALGARVGWPDAGCATPGGGGGVLGARDQVAQACDHSGGQGAARGASGITRPCTEFRCNRSPK